MQPAQYPIDPTAYHPVPAAPVAKSLQVPATLVYVGLVLSIIAVLADTALSGPFEKALARVDNDTATDTDRALLLGGVATYLVVGLVLVYTAVVFIVWLYRARRNLAIWGILGLGWGPGWAIGGWFIPLANLLIPKLV